MEAADREILALLSVRIAAIMEDEVGKAREPVGGATLAVEFRTLG